MWKGKNGKTRERHKGEVHKTRWQEIQQTSKCLNKCVFVCRPPWGNAGHWPWPAYHYQLRQSTLTACPPLFKTHRHEDKKKVDSWLHVHARHTLMIRVEQKRFNHSFTLSTTFITDTEQPLRKKCYQKIHFVPLELLIILHDLHQQQEIIGFQRKKANSESHFKLTLIRSPCSD